MTKGKDLSQLPVGLLTALTAGSGPGEVGNGDDEEAVAVVGKTSQGVVPGGKSCQETEETTCLLDLGVGVAGTIVVKVAETQEEEGQIQSEEQDEESNGGAEGAEDQNGGEDEPAKQEKTH